MSDPAHHVTFQPPVIEEVESLFPNYDIQSLIACGGMGAVYKATQRSLDRVVAIKILPREFSTDEAFRTGFEQEAKAMAKLNHPNLIGVYDFGEVGGMLYIIMEFVAGSSLFASSTGLAVEQGEAIRIVSEVCHGLAHAHKHGILHRDIKPANILLDLSFSPKIGDFGLARAPESQIEEGEQIFGTPGYTAPEILEPPYTFDHRSDIFSVGVMLHELLTASLPDADPRPASHITACNPRLDAVIKKATATNPENRYNSADDLAAELEKIASSPAKSLLTAGSAASPGRKLAKQKKLKSSSSGTPFLILLLLGIGAGAFYFIKMKGASAEDENAAPIDSSPPRTKEIVITPVSPEIAPQQMTEQDPEPIVGMPQSDPEPSPESNIASPIFDVSGFLSKARGIMRDRTAPFSKIYKTETSKNLVEFTRSLQSKISAINLPDGGVALQSQLQEASRDWREAGRVSDSLPSEFEQHDELNAVHTEYLGRQTTLGEQRQNALEQAAATYITWIEAQIERSEEANDPGAVALLEEEIEKVRSDSDYFAELMDQE